MKIYTRRGDSGATSLFSGERVAKHHIRVDTYGTVDELNAVIGLLAAGLPGTISPPAPEPAVIQSWLFHIGSWLATADPSRQAALSPILPEWTNALETAMDTMSKSLEPLKGFILPGGTLSAARAHHARTVCRRCERRLSELIAVESDTGPVPDQWKNALTLLNRLSDYFFILARFCNAQADVPDILWTDEK